jgi:dephospho-CoA kinase
VTTRRHRMVVGLTGGIGSGKSTVARLLAAQGAAVVDADAVAKSITQAGGSAIAPIRQHFGDRFILSDGSMDRDAMRQHVFEHPAARAMLEAITHPLVREGMTAAREAAPPGVVVLDIPLLVESGTWRQTVDRVVVVDCSENTQVQRVMQRNGWTEDAVRRVIDAQASRQQRLAVADAVIVNDGLSLSDLEAEVKQLGQWLGI